MFFSLVHRFPKPIVVDACSAIVAFNLAFCPRPTNYFVESTIPIVLATSSVCLRAGASARNRSRRPSPATPPEEVEEDGGGWYSRESSKRRRWVSGY